ncbi:uncharacterized protein IL334_002124 [Kwoniella shivajii]|uniref:Uncharacterized protein n=1 Tax=Kwoniella shivajii TaxID=564305 RepID=A0ABZ1CWV9_9TREE|nr:hypothetical protein IL334_002124 [Kwoniella shivajii]
MAEANLLYLKSLDSTPPSPVGDHEHQVSHSPVHWSNYISPPRSITPRYFHFEHTSPSDPIRTCNNSPRRWMSSSNLFTPVQSYPGAQTPDMSHPPNMDWFFDSREVSPGLDPTDPWSNNENIETRPSLPGTLTRPMSRSHSSVHFHVNSPNFITRSTPIPASTAKELHTGERGDTKAVHEDSSPSTFACPVTGPEMPTRNSGTTRDNTSSDSRFCTELRQSAEDDDHSDRRSRTTVEQASQIRDELEKGLIESRQFAPFMNDISHYFKKLVDGFTNVVGRNDPIESDTPSFYSASEGGRDL